MSVTALSAGIAFGSAAFSVSAIAAAQAPQQTFPVNLGEMPLSDALRQLQASTDAKLIFAPRQLSNLKTQGAVGQLTIDEALARVLAGSGFEAQGDGKESYFVVAVPRRAAGLGPRAIPRAQKPMSARRALPPRAPPAAAMSEIVVTGSRIARDGFEAPTPLTIVGAEEFATSASSNVADYLNTVPMFAGSRTALSTRTMIGSGGAAANSLNLRGLGPNRTLVLLDGQRSVASTSDGLIDINSIPQLLISRVDVVTGGASAAYGSDAVAGIVNFVLDREFVGVKAELAGDITTYGDNESWDTSLAVGTPFANGRGHFIAAGAVTDTSGVQINTRSYNLAGWQLLVNPAYGTNSNLGQSTSVPQYIVRNQSSVATATRGGIITAGPLKGVAFGEGGSPYMFPYGPIFSAPVMTGGGWQAATTRGTNIGPGLAPALKMQDVFLRTSYDVSDDINIYAQAAWTHSATWQDVSTKQDTGSLLISTQNPFMPAEIRAQADALGITQLVMGSLHADTRTAGGANDRRVQRYVVGGSGGFDIGNNHWTWQGYYQKGIAHLHSDSYNATKTSAFLKAYDPIINPATGLPACRVNADADPSNDDPQCVPYNVFGIGVNTLAAIDYVHGNGGISFRTEAPTQDVVAVSFAGTPITLRAGPVSLAFGAERRVEKVKGVNDAESRAYDWAFGNYQVYTAGMSVTEGFLETVVPLVRNAAFAELLEFNGAVRATYYSTSGYVTTWKAGLSWAPTYDVKFRATRSRDIRAPNLSDLFSTGRSASPGYLNPFRPDPATGAPTSELGFSTTRGNPALRPERSDMTSFGVVLQPEILPRFSASADYWSLNIEDALGSLGVQQIIDQCFDAGHPQICSALDFNADRSIALIKITPFNLVNQISRGIDIEVGYSIHANEVVSTLAGKFDLRFTGTHFLKRYESNGINAPVNYAGQNAMMGDIAAPNWRWRASAHYSNDTFAFSATLRGVSAGVYANAYVQCSTACPVSTVANRTIDRNHIDGAIYLDTAMAYKFSVSDGASMEAFFNVRNVFNKDPAIIAPGPGGFTWEQSPINATLYDVLGRIFRAGVRFRM